MTSLENEQCGERVSSTKKVQWSNNKLEEDVEEHNKDFITLRKSRKGINLNDPVEFNNIPTEQSTIKRLVVIPTGGCCDMEYVMAQKNKSKSGKKSTQHTDSNSYPPSITINIGASMPFHLNPVLPTYNPLPSHSTLTTSPKVLTEDRWDAAERIIPSIQEQVMPREMTPHYCESRVPYVPSREQRIINLEAPQSTINEDNLTYITKTAPPPKISPFKSCWNCLRCRRKGKEDEIYLPSITRRNKNTNRQRNVVVIPTYSRGTSFDSTLVKPDYSRVNLVPSRLSTIVESEISSQNLSQGSEPQNQKKV